MTLIKCLECGREVSDHAASCPGCGSPTVTADAAASRVQLQKRRSFKIEWLILAGVLALGVIGLLILGLMPRPGETAQQASTRRAEMRSARGAISYCDSRYAEMNDDRQYGPSELRLHANTCKMLKKQYREKWGRDP